MTATHRVRGGAWSPLVARPRPRVAARCPGFREAWAAVGRAGKLPPGGRGRCEGPEPTRLSLLPLPGTRTDAGFEPRLVRRWPDVGDQCEPQAELLGSGPGGRCLSVGGDSVVAGARAGLPLPACPRLCGVELALEAPGIGLCVASGSPGGHGPRPGTSQQGLSPLVTWPPRATDSPPGTGHPGTRGCARVVSDVRPAQRSIGVPRGEPPGQGVQVWAQTWAWGPWEELRVPRPPPGRGVAARGGTLSWPRCAGTSTSSAGCCRGR